MSFKSPLRGLPAFRASREASMGMMPEISVICPTITPTLGAELLANPGFEGVYEDESGGGGGTVMVAPNWDIHSMLTDGTNTLTASAVTVHGGAESQRLQLGQNRGVKAYPFGAIGWYQASVWVYKVSGGSIRMKELDGDQFSMTTATVGSWVQLIGTARTIFNDVDFYVAMITGAPGEFFADDASCKAITFSSTLSFLGTHSKQSGNYTCHPTVANNTQAGMAICYADANNYLLVYVNRQDGKAYLCSMIAGVWTQDISAAVVYVADAALTVTIAADSTCTLYYNSIQVGAPTVINLTTLGKLIYGFNAYDGNEVGIVTTSPF